MTLAEWQPGKRPLIMGILNVTPDSFSDGGDYSDAGLALERAQQMMEEGADIIDVGGESSRPGAEPVSLDLEWQRVGPVLQKLFQQGIPVSLDTTKAEVAKRALDLGQPWINCIDGLTSPGMAELCAERQATVCIMHKQGDPATMQQRPTYDNVVDEVQHYLVDRAKALQQLGLQQEKVILDPGIGFGKSLRHNLQLLAQLPRFVQLGYPVLVGVSRKSFLAGFAAENSAPLPPKDRLPGTLAAQVLAQQAGAAIIRVHDVREACQATLTAQAIRDSSI